MRHKLWAVAVWTILTIALTAMAYGYWLIVYAPGGYRY